MGQVVSRGSLSSLFSWSSAPSSKIESPSDCQECGNNHTEINVETFQPKNSNSFSCFKTQNNDDDMKRNRSRCRDSKLFNSEQHSRKRYYSPSPELKECRKSKRLDNTMPLSKKCYNFCNGDDNEDSTDQRRSIDNRNCNYSCVKRYDIPRPSIENNDMEEINGNTPIQSCSFENSNIRQNYNVNSTSIDKYMSAFAQRLEKINLDDDFKADSDKKKPIKSREFKKSYKQSKSKNSRECNGCTKDSKNNTKSKKKYNWGMFNGSKLRKVNNGKVSVNSAGTSKSETETGCVCTSYKKVDFNEKPDDSIFVKHPMPNHPIGLISERVNVNHATSTNWSMIAGGSNLYAQQNIGKECISCEGSHCHMDLNTLAELSNVGVLPINITVTRVGTNNNSHSGSNPSESNVIFVSLATQNAPVIDLSQFNSNDHPLEDCEERARVRRAREIAEGVEPPPGYNSPHIQVVSRELRTLLFQPHLPTTTQNMQPLPHHARIHTQVDYIHCLVPDLRSITSCSFYWGKMDRYEAERLLDGKDEGTFLLRDSAQEEYLFSVSFRKYQRSLHARIEQFNHKFSFDSHDPGVFASDTVTGLIEHYKDPTCVMFFEPMLTAPLSRTFTFPLQHLCRAVIVSCTTYDGINELKLPTAIKAYLKEYHYRQRVRVKRFDETPEAPEET